MLRVKEVCREKGITITELAEKMGMAQGNLSKTLNGNPTVETLYKVSEILGVNTGDLFEKEVGLTCPKCGTRLKLVEE